MPYTNILIPLDGSPDSFFALETAIEFSRSDPAARMYHLVYCADPIPSLISGEKRQKLVRDQRLEVDAIFAKAKELLERAGSPCRAYLREGNPGDEIARAAEETGSDAIIMGTRGHGRLKSLLLGSVSRDVLARSKVPVILANKP